MALWFCEIRAREIINYGNNNVHHMKNPFLSRAELSKRAVVNIEDLLEAQQDQKKQFI
jgi:hypothetical protein